MMKTREDFQKEYLSADTPEAKNKVVKAFKKSGIPFNIFTRVAKCEKCGDELGQSGMQCRVIKKNKVKHRYCQFCYEDIQQKVG